MTNTTALTPRPNHSRASGISAMAGSGLNIEVSVSRISAPSRVVTARVVRTRATPAPIAMPVSSTFSDWAANPGISPLASARPKASSTAEAGGNSNGLTANSRVPASHTTSSASTMAALRIEGGLHPPLRGPHGRAVALADGGIVEDGAHAARMGGQDQDAVAQQHGLL